ncbi:MULTISPECIES: hypothetical protein [Streptococcus]|jgi:hypothetical protein|uniref:PqqD family protein n=1 Tax=Streptococcus salivarius TaxID=1304 RepID=A0AA45CQP3_STRSL|nr:MULTISPECIES: hypothetical protein [Streptococcus]MBK5079928.1 hypothetical protein [Streptococcus sp. 22.1]MDU2002269.1 hypothetical protein [Streptococcus salivarius]MDU2073546.1 hypothetical protein [Streptococcus salivarius]MDU2933468.1 hypothetical protein [Streptococcus salivarius]PZD55327.1 hypothetical protein CKU37_11265 [Streptococcus salivarius]
MAETNLKEYQKNPKFRIRKFNGRIYIFNRDRAFEINTMSLEIWKNIGKDITLSNLVEKMYGESNTNIENKIMEFVDFLCINELIIRVDS